MQTLPLPYEVKASFRVPRHKAEKVVAKFKARISFPGLLPKALRSSDAGVDPDSGDGSDVTLWVLFQPTHRTDPVAKRSPEEGGAVESDPVSEFSYDDFISPAQTSRAAALHPVPSPSSAR